MTSKTVTGNGGRREFLRAAGQAAAVGGLAALAAWLVGRREAVPAARGPAGCEGGTCAGCLAFHDCGLPRALSTRQAAAKDKP